jgi:hypothetical protein
VGCYTISGFELDALLHPTMGPGKQTATARAPLTPELPRRYVKKFANISFYTDFLPINWTVYHNFTKHYSIKIMQVRMADTYHTQHEGWQ